MKTISIKNGLFWSGVQKLRVTVNGKAYTMKEISFRIDVDENAPLEIKVSRGWSCSTAYSFEPKDNLLLRISENPQIRKRYILLGLLGALLFACIGGFTEIRWMFTFTPALMWLLPAIYITIMRKNYFVIQEAS